MTLSTEENEIVDHLREIARLRRALLLVKNVAELDIRDVRKIITQIINDTLGIE